MPRNRLVVLVVEDEPLVRALAVDALEDEGFEVIEASTGDYALAVLKARRDVDVVLTDVDRMIHETTGAHWLGAGPQRTG
jgi:CheY-like chemotaxis protein